MLTLSTELEDNIILVYLYGNNERYLFFVSLFASFLIIITKSRSARRVFTICTFKNNFIPCEVLFNQ